MCSTPRCRAAQCGEQTWALDRRVYGPLLLCLPPEPLAVITLHCALSSLLGGKPSSGMGGAQFDTDMRREAGSARVINLVLQIGKARHAAAALRCLLRLPEGARGGAQLQETHNAGPECLKWPADGSERHRRAVLRVPVVQLLPPCAAPACSTGSGAVARAAQAVQQQVHLDNMRERAAAANARGQAVRAWRPPSR